jgi:predicted AlkP superfamily phosphohydrolase/phosphomutase
MEGMLFSSLFDWTKTRAYSLGSYGNIYINVKGREPDGIVDPGDEYEQLRDAIITRLKELKDPTSGRQVVKKVYRREELYQGPFLHKAADLIVVWSDEGYHSVQRFGSKEDSIFGDELHFHLTKIRYTGHHRLNGIFAIRGNGVKKNFEINGAEIIDLAPTIFYVLGIPIPSDIDGKILTNVFTDDHLQQHPLRYEKSGSEKLEHFEYYTEDEEKRISERLRGLGYIE